VTHKYKGSAEAIESKGAIKTFCSIVPLEVHHILYIADGDSNSFSRIADEKPYSDSVKITDNGYVWHVQKCLRHWLMKFEEQW